jgi:hypothetical protein
VIAFQLFASFHNIPPMLFYVVPSKIYDHMK